MAGFELKATDLELDGGFNGGEMFAELLGAAGIDYALNPVRSFPQSVLVRAVETYLLPLLPGVSVLQTIGGHNPIRVVGVLADRHRTVSAFLTEDQVLALARQLIDEDVAAQLAAETEAGEGQA